MTDAVAELREAARQLHNLTLGDPTVRISAPTPEKRDAIAAAGQRLRDALAAVPSGVQGTAAKLCNYCGVVVDSGMVCTHDGEFNDCPNKQISEAIDGVLVNDQQSSCDQVLTKAKS